MLVRWAPFNDVTRLRDEMDRLFGGEGVWNPPFDVTEDADQIRLEADLPGVPQEKIDIQVVEGVLTVKGERKLARESGRLERVSGVFERSFKLPPTIDTESISASTKDGVLMLKLPKRAETRPRQIKVNPS
jgi:HSP20 family protein